MTESAKFQIPWAGLCTALVWAISPIFIRAGLEEFQSPVVGVAIGLLVNVHSLWDFFCGYANRS